MTDVTHVDRASQAWLTDPTVFEVNRTPAHSSHKWYARDPQSGQWSDLKQSLDGEWRVEVVQAADINLEEEPATAESFDDSSFERIQVPGHLQTAGLMNHKYVNVQYPWDGHENPLEPNIPENNHVALYRRKFTVSAPVANAKQAGGSVSIVFHGMATAIYVWVNGAFVGYGEDGFTPNEFDITELLHDGENVVAVACYEYSSASWLEDQDFWRLHGLFRSVELAARPHVHIENTQIEADWDPEAGTASLDAALTVLNAADAATVRATLKDADGNTVWQTTGDAEAQTAISSGPLQGIAPWSAESPTLYELDVDVIDQAGDVIECTSQKVGFRRFRIEDGILTINGKRIVFKGANRHEFSSITGRAVGVHTHEELLRDIITMKQNNINAIRTSHYQNQDALYDLCDEYGLYLIAENNLESHGTWDIHQAGIRGIEGVLPNDKPEWKAVLFDRMNSTYQRDKNHPAVLIWSLGNESFGGETLLQMAEMVRRFDDTRLVHYEGVVNDPRFLETTDIESHMYSTVKDIKEYLAQGDKRPYIECEYSHAMGNSNGALHKYTELADQKDCGYQGGFIWDYIDQSIWKKDRYGKWFQAYGGDFGERPTDYNFSGNGIAYGGDRAPSPKMQEVKFCYQNIAVSIDNSGFEVWNKNLFTSTDAFDCVALLHRDGKLYQQQELTNIDVAPEERSSFPLPFMVPALPGEYAVTISFRLKEDTSWAKKGHEVAFGQGVIAVVRSIPSKKVTPFTVTHGTHNIGVRGENFDVLFSDLNGGLTSYRYAGKEMIQEIPRPNFWRAPTDNDCGNNMGGVRGQWKLASLYATAKGIGKEIPSVHGGTILQNPTCEVEADSVVVTYLYNLQTSPAAECSLQYRVFGDGRIQTTLHYDPVEGLAAMPEFGVLFKIDADYDTVEWYGNGPAETYWDRQHGAKLGIYQNKVADNMAQYLVPQECGAKTAVRWAKVVDRKGRGLLFTADAAKPMFFSALPYTPHEMESAKHPYELPPVHYTVIRAMGEQMGVGGDDSWGANVHPEYIPDVTKPVEFTFTFRGI